MFKEFHKNDYKFRKDLKDFGNKNPLGKLIKPLFKGIYKFIDGYLPYPRDFLLKRIPKDGICCEVGVYEGIFSERIVRICKPRKLYLIDPWQAIPDRMEEKYSQKYQNMRHDAVVSKLADPIAKGTVTVLRKTSDAATGDVPDGSCDFVYVDGDHRYEQVKRDLKNYYPKVKAGGLLCGDDYHIPGVQQAVDEFVREEGKTVEIKDRQFIITK